MSTLTQSETKVCSLCSEEKPSSNFVGKRCRSCRTKMNRERIQSNPNLQQKRRDSVRKWSLANPEKKHERYRKAHLKYEFGLTVEEYNKMLEEQNGVCAICKRTETFINGTGRVVSLAVDHDHETGKVRGLLCKDCNQSLGKFNDSAELLLRAYNYLISHKDSQEVAS